MFIHASPRVGFGCDIGCYHLSEIANMDQTPISFEFLGCRSYDAKGARSVWVKTDQSRWDKCQATLQILVHADGVPRCKPLLIFHSSAGKKNARMMGEAKNYDP